MNKRTKRLPLLLVLLLMLLGVFLGLKKYNEVQSEAEAERDAGTVIVEVAPEEVVRLSYDYDGVTYSYVKKEDTWYYEADESLEVTQYLITNMLDKVAPLTVEQTIENVTDMSQYGLAEEVRTIHYETEAASYIFEVGSYNSVSDVYYIRKPSDTVVYAVSAPTITVFNKAREDIVTEPVETAEETVQTEESK